MQSSQTFRRQKKKNIGVINFFFLYFRANSRFAN